ncbi:MAG TPA: hypothetical protein ENF52_07815 [Chloroflexi bacterium]|nr:hypothetical protein [Chloroflexota bacterium]
MLQSAPQEGGLWADSPPAPQTLVVCHRSARARQICRSLILIPRGCRRLNEKRGGERSGKGERVVASSAVPGVWAGCHPPLYYVGGFPRVRMG